MKKSYFYWKKCNTHIYFIFIQVEHISQLQSFIEAQAEYHRQAMETLQTLVETLEDK